MSEEFAINFEGMTKEEINSAIIRNLREIISLNAKKKDFMAGVKDAIKELDNRIALAIAELDRR
jgi:hypothetical protein